MAEAGTLSAAQFLSSRQNEKRSPVRLELGSAMLATWSGQGLKAKPKVRSH